MSYPADENGDVFRRLESHGFDFTTEHVVDFHAVLATEKSADIVALMFLADDKAGDTYENIETYPHDEGGMCLDLSKKMFVSYDAVTKLESLLANRISDNQGYLDGWGVLH